MGRSRPDRARTRALEHGHHEHGHGHGHGHDDVDEDEGAHLGEQPLQAVHPGLVPPVAMSRWTLATWALAVSGRPRGAALLTAVAAGLLARRLPIRERRVPVSVRLVAVGTLKAGEQLARAATRTWWPVAVPAAVASRRARLAVGTAVVAACLIDWVGCGRPVDLGRFLAAHLVDDLSYCAGVWRGCV